MRKVIIQNYEQAVKHIEAGKNPLRRAVSGYLELYRNSTSPTEPIYLRFSKSTDQWIVKYHDDNSIEIQAVRWDGAHIQLNEYARSRRIQVFWKKGKRQFWLPALGKTAIKNIKCAGCGGTGSARWTCNGPGTCRDALRIPKHLRDTGAPGAHCSHFQTEEHYLGTCNHGEPASHRYHDGHCWQCGNTGRKDIGGRLSSIDWDGSPIRIHSDGMIAVMQTDAMPGLPDSLKVRPAAA